MHIISIDHEETIAVLRENPYFKGLDEFILRELAEDTVLRGYPRGEVLFWQDEPSAGLAPLLVKRLFEILKDLRKEFNLTILLVEQNAEVALEFADRGLVLAQGQIMLEGEARTLINEEEVRKIYLGNEGTNSR